MMPRSSTLRVEVTLARSCPQRDFGAEALPKILVLRQAQHVKRVTESGAALRPVLEGLGRWAQTHMKECNTQIVGIS